jgi:hypothetical protein
MSVQTTVLVNVNSNAVSFIGTHNYDNMLESVYMKSSETQNKGSRNELTSLNTVSVLGSCSDFIVMGSGDAGQAKL